MACKFFFASRFLCFRNADVDNSFGSKGALSAPNHTLFIGFALHWIFVASEGLSNILSSLNAFAALEARECP